MQFHNGLPKSSFLRAEVANLIGTWVNEPFQCPTIISVLPLMAAWTALVANTAQNTASSPSAGTLLIE